MADCTIDTSTFCIDKISFKHTIGCTAEDGDIMAKF